jgi:hypothetical protein
LHPSAYAATVRTGVRSRPHDMTTGAASQWT